MNEKGCFQSHFIPPIAMIPDPSQDKAANVDIGQRERHRCSSGLYEANDEMTVRKRKIRTKVLKH